MRSVTIDAENEEDFIKEYDRTRKSRMTEMYFKETDEENLSEMDEDDLSGLKHKNQELQLDDEDGGYEGLGPMNDDENDDVGQDYENDNVLKDSEEAILKGIDNPEEKNLELLCIYLKNSIAVQSKNKVNVNGDNIFYRNKNPLYALSGNAIYDLNVRELVDNIMTEEDNEGGTNSGDPNSLKEFISQNIESDCNLKIMFISNNRSIKNLIVEKFFGITIVNTKNQDEALDVPFEIRKKQIRLFNKNISLQVFDTSDIFHSNPVSSAYYKTAGAFFIFIDATNHNVISYLDSIYSKLEKHATNKTIVIFGINLLFKEDCTIDNENLRDYALDKNFMFIPIKINEFNMKNSLIVNLLNLILIKRIDSKPLRESMVKFNREKRLGGMKKKLTKNITDSSQVKKNIYDISKMKIPNSMGYKKKYRIKHINAFDIEDDSNSKRRKWSVDL